jgi:hypothetical protein
MINACERCWLLPNAGKSTAFMHNSSTVTMLLTYAGAHSVASVVLTCVLLISWVACSVRAAMSGTMLLTRVRTIPNTPSVRRIHLMCPRRARIIPALLNPSSGVARHVLSARLVGCTLMTASSANHVFGLLVKGAVFDFIHFESDVGVE